LRNSEALFDDWDNVWIEAHGQGAKRKRLIDCAIDSHCAFKVAFPLVTNHCGALQNFIVREFLTAFLHKGVVLSNRKFYDHFPPGIYNVGLTKFKRRTERPMCDQRRPPNRSVEYRPVADKTIGMMSGA
jgi:hypothetical protein